jgi:hypothetical protein
VHVGTSPRNFRGTTVGDELKNAGLPSRVVAVAIKDRAAIFMGGKRADLALWFDAGAWKWVSSKYYLPDGKLPGWVERLNADVARDKGREAVLDKQGPGTGLTPDGKALILDGSYYDRAGHEFPHKVAIGKSGALNLPYGLQITAQAAARAIDAYQLGRGKATDLLAVSFSSHDYLGHAFGPNTREMEEMTVADDRAIAQLLNHVRTHVPGGLKNVLIVLSADHGVSPNPDYLKQNRIEAGRIDSGELLKRVEERAEKRFGRADGKWVPFVMDLNFYFNDALIAEKGLDRAELEREVKAVVAAHPGAAHVFSRADYLARRLPPMQFERQILKTYVPGRSGDVVMIPKPFWFEAGDTAGHMTGYAYDRTVPLILAGARVRPGRYSQRAEIVDVAPTLTYLSGVLPPALTDGRVLSEAIRE